ncbi:MAG: NADH-quinone oxidoreductase subunit K [Gemmatimonadales bacterium]
MELPFVLAVGVLVAVAVYLLLSRNVLRMLIGFLVLSNGVNLAIFIAGRFGSRVPPLVPPGETTIAVSANPLPQALILTAIVISFALAAFTAVLLHGAYRKLGTVDSDAMRLAEGSSPGQGTGPGAEAA